MVRVEWKAINGATVVSLSGSLVAEDAAVLAALSDAALDVPRLVIDLEFVNAIDDAGIALLESLSDLANVGVVNVSDAVSSALLDSGRLGF